MALYPDCWHPWHLHQRDQRRGLVQLAAPLSEPVSLAEAKLHLRVDDTDEDDLIGSLVTAARQVCEQHLDQAFVSQTWLMTLDRFPSWEIEVPIPPLRSITGVTYLDVSGVQQTLAPSAYVVDTAVRPGRITPAWASCWPPYRWQPGAVQITYVAGYGSDASGTPAAIKAAIKLLVGNWYENRESTVVGTIATELPRAVDALLRSCWHGGL